MADMTKTQLKRLDEMIEKYEQEVSYDVCEIHNSDEDARREIYNELYCDNQFVLDMLERVKAYENADLIERDKLIEILHKDLHTKGSVCDYCIASSCTFEPDLFCEHRHNIVNMLNRLPLFNSKFRLNETVFIKEYKCKGKIVQAFRSKRENTTNYLVQFKHKAFFNSSDEIVDYEQWIGEDDLEKIPRFKPKGDE